MIYISIVINEFGLIKMINDFFPCLNVLDSSGLPTATVGGPKYIEMG